MMSISVCIIAKNESDQIAECINCVKDYVDEIIVIDNDSEDNTRDEAIKAGARVIWSDKKLDLARNEYLKAASCDWILVLDADERILKEDIRKIKETTDLNSTAPGFVIPCYNYYGNGKYAIFNLSRLFRMQPNLSYDRPIHARIRSNLNTENKKFDILFTPIHHLDALKSIERNNYKRERNIKLTESFISSNSHLPLTQLGMLYCHLGREYLGKKEYDKAFHYFTKALEFDNKGVSIISLAQYYKMIGNWILAIEWANKYFDFLNNNFTNELLWRKEAPIAVLTNAYYGLGDYKTALKYIEEGVQNLSYYPHHFINKWWIQNKLGKREDELLVIAKEKNQFYKKGCIFSEVKGNIIYDIQGNFIDDIKLDWKYFS